MIAYQLSYDFDNYKRTEFQEVSSDYDYIKEKFELLVTETALMEWKHIDAVAIGRVVAVFDEDGEVLEVTDYVETIEEHIFNPLKYETFKEYFDEFRSSFDGGSGHPEYFYVNFYLEHIHGKWHLFTEEEKREWVADWIEALDADELEGRTFEEILGDDNYDFLGEDIAEYVVDSEEPKFAELKEKFTHLLFLEMSKDQPLSLR